MIKAIVVASFATFALGQVMDDVFVDNDFLTQDEIRAQFEPEDFLIKYDTPPITGPGGSLTLRLVDSTPIIGGIRGGGIATGVLELEPCGVVTPQSHPGTAENIFPITGPLRVGFVGTGRVIEEEVNAMESFQIPPGLVHWIANESCQSMTAQVSLSGGDPGVVLAGPALFSVPDAALYATLPGISMEMIETVQAAALGAGVLNVNPVCVQRCAEGGSGGYGEGGSRGYGSGVDTAQE